MNPLLRKIVGRVAWRVANDPVARRHMVEATKKVVREAREFAISEDPVNVAGQVVRRTLNKLKRRDG